MVATPQAARNTIQADVDWHLSKENEEQYNFATMNLTGPCELVRSVNIRFYNDKFIGFKAIKGNNNLYFKNCHFGEYFQLTNGVAMFEACVFATPPVFTSCKIDFVGQNEITKTVYLNDKTFLKSNENNYTFPTVFIMTKNSRLESFKDIYEGPVQVYKAKENCYIKSVKPTFTGLSGPIFLAEDNCTLHISDTIIEQSGPPLFDMLDSCSLQAFNIEKISVTDVVLKQVNKCKSLFKNIPIIESSNDIYQCVDSDLTALNITQSKAENNFFTNNGIGNYSFKLFDLVQANNYGFAIDGGNVRITGKDGSLITTNKEVIVTSGNNVSNISMCVLEKAESTSSPCLNLNKAYANLSQIKQVIGKTIGIIARDNSYIKTNKITNIIGTTLEGINIESNSIAISTFVTNITGQTYGIAAENNSHIAVNGVTNIRGNTLDGISTINNSSVVLNNVTSTIGTRTGISAATNCKVVLKNALTISGSTTGISLVSSDLTYSTTGGSISGADGIKAQTDTPGKNRIKIYGPVTVSGSYALTAIGYSIDDRLVTWSGNIATSNSIWDSKYATGNDVNSSNSSIDATLSNFQKVNPDSSSISLKKTSFSEAHQKNSTIFGSQISGPMYFDSDDAYTGAKALFVTSGNMGLQADDTIFMRAAKLEGSLRTSILMDTRGTSTYSSTGLTTISGNPIMIKSDDLIQIQVDPSVIMIMPAYIGLQSAVVDILSG